MTIFFMHVPKTGGMTVEEFLKDATGVQSVAPYGREDLIASCLQPDVTRYRIYCSHAPAHVRQILPQPVLSIAWLRDPIDRAISAYNHILREPTHPSHECLTSETHDFESAILHPQLRSHFLEVITRFFGSHVDLRIFSHCTNSAFAASIGARDTAPDKYTFARAKENLRGFHFIGFCERMDRDCRLLGRLLGFNPQVKPKFVNADPGGYLDRPKVVRNRDIEALLNQHSPYDFAMYKLAQQLWPDTAT
jgi:Sulfotransferase family